MMNFEISEQEMIFENEQFITTMIIKGKGEGHDKGELRLRCYVAIILRVKGTENVLNLRANIYWDTQYPKTHLFFTGGSLKEFITEQDLEYDNFKTYWDKVKRLASNVFTDEEILEYRKLMNKSVKA